MSLHTLLAATDFSAPSHHTAKRAAMLAQQIGAKLELVHVLDKNELNELLRLLSGNGEAWQERIRSQARESLSQLANNISEPHSVKCWTPFGGGRSTGEHRRSGGCPQRESSDCWRTWNRFHA